MFPSGLYQRLVINSGFHSGTTNSIFEVLWSRIRVKMMNRIYLFNYIRRNSIFICLNINF